MAHLDFEKPLVELERRIRALQGTTRVDPATKGQLDELRRKADSLQASIYDDLSTWQKVQLSRHPDRPYFLDHAEYLFDDLVELHGDRRYADDPAIVGGFAEFRGRKVMVIGQQKGRTTKQKLHRNFGMPQPEGYRKAIRLMELADRYKRPVLTFIDTPGAFPGIGAEERGQSEAIGASLLTMSRLRVPIVATVIGEGGSGGALALGVANRVLMLRYATYSVITPEGCASILWRDGAKAPAAAEQLCLLSADAERTGAVDGVIDEPSGGAHRDPELCAKQMGDTLDGVLDELGAMSADELVEQRYARFRKLGVTA